MSGTGSGKTHKMAMTSSREDIGSSNTGLSAEANAYAGKRSGTEVVGRDRSERVPRPGGKREVGVTPAGSDRFRGDRVDTLGVASGANRPEPGQIHPAIDRRLVFQSRDG